MKHLIAIPIVAVLLGGCASNPSNGPVYDPLESVNRKIYSFNTQVDRVILKPVARGYRFITPNFVESGVDNFFSNLDDVTVLVNDLLQGKVRQAGMDTGRFLLNSTVGILGFIDVGTRVGLPKHNESFGQTFGVWGIGEGPYLVLPFLNANNARTTAGLTVEAFTTDLVNYVEKDKVRIPLQVLDIVALRARLLDAGNLFDAAALDPYLMFRDFWVQQHRRLTCDGKCDVRLGTNTSGDTDELDELDQLDALDGPDELDELDELDALDGPDESDELDDPDQSDDTDQPDNTDQPDELDELDALDVPN